MYFWPIEGLPATRCGYVKFNHLQANILDKAPRLGRTPWLKGVTLDRPLRSGSHGTIFMFPIPVQQRPSFMCPTSTFVIKKFHHSTRERKNDDCGCSDPDLVCSFESDAYHELAVHLSLGSLPGIVPVVPVVDTDGTLMLMSKRFSMSLRDAFGAREWTGWDAKIVLTLVTDALHRVHKNGWLHLDLKAANILIDSHAKDSYGLIALTDFGAALPLFREKRSRQVVEEIVTSTHRAPELYARHDVSTATDWFSWGITILHFIVNCRVSEQLPATNLCVFPLLYNDEECSIEAQNILTILAIQDYLTHQQHKEDHRQMMRDFFPMTVRSNIRLFSFTQKTWIRLNLNDVQHRMALLVNQHVKKVMDILTAKVDAIFQTVEEKVAIMKWLSCLLNIDPQQRTVNMPPVLSIDNDTSPTQK